jgi:hypothetical protein
MAAHRARFIRHVHGHSRIPASLQTREPLPDRKYEPVPVDEPSAWPAFNIRHLTVHDLAPLVQ